MTDEYRHQDKGHKRKPCIDCKKRAEASGTPMPRRKAPHPGPRCTSCHRLKQAERKSTTRGQRWMSTYGISPDEYWAIYEAQGGVCYICQRANGTGRRALSVDHCHKTGVVRGLLCSHDNRQVLGQSRDDIEFFQRCIEYLQNPPAIEVIGKRIVPGHKET